MASQYLHALILLIVIHVTEASSEAEPHCPRCSKYEYEEKTLGKLIRMEFQWTIFNEKWNSMEQNIKETMKVLKDAEEWRNQSQKAREENLKDKILELNEAEVQRENRLIAFQEKQKEDISNTITNAHQQVIRMSQDMIEYQTAMNKTLLAYKAPIVFFSVHSPTRNLVDDVPTFSTVLGNVGDGYDTTTGVFTCTVPGLYMFSLTFVRSTSTSGYLYCNIRHNGVKTVYAYTRTTSSSTDHQSASATINMNLVSGDKVDVGGCYKWNLVKTGSTGMFSGALITAA